MKLKILIKENINKTYNVLNFIKDNKNLSESLDTVQFYNDENWLSIFTKAYEDWKQKQFERFIIIDDYAYGPFLFFSKQDGLIATSAFDEYSANLIRGHNNSKICIIPVLRTQFEKVNNIINAFCVTNFLGNRHTTRLTILHNSFSLTNTPLQFSDEETKTVVVGSDHAGFALKEASKEYLLSKGYKVIDVGTYSLDSTHYPLFGIAIASHIHECDFAIGFCYTGMGIANSLNKFKGVRACICTSVDNATVARQIYGANTLVMGSRFSKKEEALKTIDTFFSTPCVDNPVYKPIDNYGFAFDVEKFKKIEIESTIIVPKELK